LVGSKGNASFPHSSRAQNAVPVDVTGPSYPAECITELTAFVPEPFDREAARRMAREANFLYGNKLFLLLFALSNVGPRLTR
jgi:hypothetical protein